MIHRNPTHCGDETCPASVECGGLIFLAHHAGGFERADYGHQARATLSAMGATLAKSGAGLRDMAQINLYLKNLEGFDAAREAIREAFGGECPARMTLTSEFLNPECLLMMDGVAAKPGAREGGATACG